MYDIFDKHGKKLLAVLGSVLMLTFLLPYGVGRGGGGNGRLGVASGRAVTVDDVNAARDVMAGLNHLLVANPQPGANDTGPVPLPDALFGQQLARNLRENPLQFYLLLDEAQRNGGVADPQGVEFCLGDTNSYQAGDGTPPIALKDLNPNIKDALRVDVRAALAVSDYFRRARDYVKVSRPLVDDLIARRTQQLKARVAVFAGPDFAAKVQTPTADELKRQFDNYAKLPPNQVSENDPFGFGYLVPDRVHLQYLTVSDADVAALVEKTQSPEKWAEDAMIYYRRHPSEFQTATTQPTTKLFADAQADALKKVHAPLLDAQRRRVATLAAKLLADSSKLTAATAPTTADAAAGLAAVADAVQKQTGVRPLVADVPGLLDRDAVTNLTGLGNADPSDAGRPYDPAAPGDTAGYLFGSLKPFVDAAAADAKTNNRPAPPAPTFGVLDVMAPSKILRGTSAVYVVRVTDASPAHPPAMADVKDQVEKDVRRAAAYGLAQAAAQDAIKSADAVGTIEKIAGVNATTTDWFGESGPQVAGLPAEVAAKLGKPAFDTLAGLTNRSQLPRRTLARLRSDDRAIAVEVFDAKAMLTPGDVDQVREEATQNLAQQVADPTLIVQWFGMDGVSKRVGYVAEGERQTPQSPAGSAGSPFTP